MNTGLMHSHTHTHGQAGRRTENRRDRWTRTEGWRDEGGADWKAERETAGLGVGIRSAAAWTFCSPSICLFNLPAINFAAYPRCPLALRLMRNWSGAGSASSRCPGCVGWLFIPVCCNYRCMNLHPIIWKMLLFQLPSNFSTLLLKAKTNC